MSKIFTRVSTADGEHTKTISQSVTDTTAKNDPVIVKKKNTTRKIKSV